MAAFDAKRLSLYNGIKPSVLICDATFLWKNLFALNCPCFINWHFTSSPFSKLLFNQWCCAHAVLLVLFTV